MLSYCLGTDHQRIAKLDRENEVAPPTKVAPSVGKVRRLPFCLTSLLPKHLTRLSSASFSIIQLRESLDSLQMSCIRIHKSPNQRSCVLSLLNLTQITNLPTTSQLLIIISLFNDKNLSHPSIYPSQHHQPPNPLSTVPLTLAHLPGHPNRPPRETILAKGSRSESERETFRHPRLRIRQGHPEPSNSRQTRTHLGREAPRCEHWRKAWGAKEVVD